MLVGLGQFRRSRGGIEDWGDWKQFHGIRDGRSMGDFGGIGAGEGADRAVHHLD